MGETPWCRMGAWEMGATIRIFGRVCSLNCSYCHTWWLIFCFCKIEVPVSSSWQRERRIVGVLFTLWELTFLLLWLCWWCLFIFLQRRTCLNCCWYVWSWDLELPNKDLGSLFLFRVNTMQISFGKGKLPNCYIFILLSLQCVSLNL